jgi:ubiquinone/menaquinone biosynthesis C-methylase UbiE
MEEAMLTNSAYTRDGIPLPLEPADVTSDFTDLRSLYRFRPEYPEGAVATICGRITDFPLDLHVIEVGAGTGLFTRPLARNLTPRRTIIATDPHDGMLSEAKALAAGLAGSSSVVFHRGNAEALSAGDTSVCLVAAACAVHRFDRARFYNECARTLVPGGFLCTVEYQLDVSTEIGDAVFSLLENMVPGYNRSFHSTAAGAYEPVNILDELRRRPDFQEAEQMAFRWNELYDEEHFVGYVRAMTPTMKAERSHGEATVTQMITDIFHRFGATSGRAEVPFRCDLILALRASN